MSGLRNLFCYRKSDKDAIVLLVIVVMACVVLIPLLATKGEEESRKTDTAYSKRNTDNRYYAQPGSNDGSIPADDNCELFPFDPNTADSTQLLRLGLKPWQVRSIYRYRSKGGRYYKKSDFARLYGLTLKKYKQLEPYITIKQEVMAADVIKEDKQQDNYQQAEKHPATESNSGVSRYVSNKLKSGETVDINTADTTELKRIPGIGSYFARHIVDLRQRRQAFVDVNELLAIRNFPETALTYMTASQTFPTIYINKATQKELERHPLINYVQARDIIRLRNTRGHLVSVKELSFLSSFTPEMLKRITPFVVFEE